MNNQLDIILFGASGFTGTYCIESLHKLTKLNGQTYTWGIAGRSEKRLKDALQEYQNQIGEDLSSIPIITADVYDFNSLKKMTARAKVVINCCGPFRFYGEPVIKACLETGTHQVDVSGEPQYMETIQLKYNAAAQEKGIYIVSACGFDSIIADLGMMFLREKFEGTVNSVEAYLQFIGSGEDSVTNYATYESAVYGFGAAKELHALRKKLYTNQLPKLQPRLKPRPSIHKSDIINKWCVPFLGADRSVIQRSQRYLYEHKKVRPIQVQTYLGLQSLYGLIRMIILGAIFSFLAKYKRGRTFLLKHPSLFTAGYVKPERCSKLTHIDKSFEMLFQAQGWNEKLSDATDEFKTSPNKKMTMRSSDNHPIYTFTGHAATLSAIVILNEIHKLPKSGGVYTPGIAFQETSLTKKLQETGLKFEIL